MIPSTGDGWDGSGTARQKVAYGFTIRTWNGPRDILLSEKSKGGTVLQCTTVLKKILKVHI